MPAPRTLRKSAETFHVGEYIADELAERGWTVRELAERMGGNPAINELSVELALHVRDPRAFVGPKMADGLARAFGTSAQLWLNLDRAWRLGAAGGRP